MKKPFVISLILTILVAFIFFVPINYQYKRTKHNTKEFHLRVLEEKTNLVAKLTNECADSIYQVETNMFRSEMYVLKGFDNLDSLEKIINESYGGSLIEQIDLWINKEKSWIGSTMILESNPPYFFTFNVDKENEIAVFSATDTNHFNMRNDFTLHMTLMITILGVILVYIVSLGLIYWSKK